MDDDGTAPSALVDVCDVSVFRQSPTRSAADEFPGSDSECRKHGPLIPIVKEHRYLP